jgi:hypothetical protein
MKLKIKFSFLLLCMGLCFLNACFDDEVKQDDDDWDGRPVWVTGDGYADLDYYGVGVFGGGFEETLSEKINGGQLDARNKLKHKLAQASREIINNWADAIYSYQGKMISEHILDQALEKIVNTLTETRYTEQIESWTDPQSNDSYVLLKVSFNDFEKIVKQEISQVIVMELSDNARQSHVELGREIEKKRRLRMGR